MRWLACLLTAIALAEPAPQVLKDVPYRTGDDQTAYERERCRLDLTLPAPAAQPFATYVWFYGGGLKNGGKDVPSEYCAEIARSFAREGIAVVVPDYRLNPRAKYPEYVDDAAAAFAWTLRNIARHGGDPRKVFLGGHSAGGYLALLVGFDESRLRPYGFGLKDIAKAMRAEELIDVSWGDGPADGVGAMAAAYTADASAAAEGKRLADYDYFREGAEYNEADCRSMFLVLAWLREHR